MSKSKTWMGTVNSALIAGVGVLGSITTSAINAPTAIAHGANITTQAVRAYEITAVYDSGDPMVGAQVSVFGEANPKTAIETGTTDAQGSWVWMAPQPGTWTFQVRQAGHGGLAELEVLPQGEPVDLASPDGSATTNEALKTSQALAAHQASGESASPLPRWIAIGSVLWGAIGTALFFSRRSIKPVAPVAPAEPSNHPLSRT